MNRIEPEKILNLSILLVSGFSYPKLFHPAGELVLVSPPLRAACSTVSSTEVGAEAGFVHTPL